MNQIPFDKCSFDKTNLVTKSGGYDEYKCRECGIIGKRYGLSDSVTTKSVCHRHKPNVEQSPGRRIRIVSKYVENQFGLKLEGEYDTVEIPDQFKTSMPNSTWVYSEQRGEPVCLLKHEFTPV